MICPEGAEWAIVVRVSGPTVTVCHRGQLGEARVIPRLPDRPAAAGDRVRLRIDGADLSVVEIAPRTTRLERADGKRRRPRLLVANADLLLIAAAIDEPPLRRRLIDRYLVAAELGGLNAAIVLTKADLPHDADHIKTLAASYEALGYPVRSGVSSDPALVAQVRELVGQRLGILAGHSGVGKSTLTSALTGIARATGAVSAKVRTGRHTTSDPRLIAIPGGGGIVDTAGVRTFNLPALSQQQLEQGFREIAAIADRCRFHGCAHDGDAGCAAPEHVDPDRLDSYRRLLHDLD